MSRVHPPGNDDLALEASIDHVRSVSSQLNASRALLDERIAELQGQLAQANAQRRDELAETERLASRLQSVLDVLPGGVIVIDGQGRVREANPLAIELLGAPLQGAFWRDVIARSFAPRKDDGHEISLRDGRRLSIATRSLGGEPGQLVLLTDLTETRRLQAHLAHNERLSALGRMVASLAHQIRTPLSSALLYAGHLHDGGLDEEQRLRFSARLKERLHELERQVRDMLVFARGDLPLHDRLPVKGLFDALREASECLLQDVRVRWQCDVIEGQLLCNRDTLVGALLNLLDNAQQAAGGEARIKVHAYPRGADLRVCISDNGPGLDRERLARLGEPFFTTRTTGTGLGLAVAKTVVRAHHGRMSIASRPGRGTCVTLVLPLLASNQPGVMNDSQNSAGRG